MSCHKKKFIFLQSISSGRIAFWEQEFRLVELGESCALQKPQGINQNGRLPNTIANGIDNHFGLACRAKACKKRAISFSNFAAFGEGFLLCSDSLHSFAFFANNGTEERLER